MSYFTFRVTWAHKNSTHFLKFNRKGTIAKAFIQ